MESLLIMSEGTLSLFTQLAKPRKNKKKINLVIADPVYTN
jgi:hypothetical protein